MIQSTRRVICFLLGAPWLLMSAICWAQDHHQPSAGHEASKHATPHEFHRNVLGVFLGSNHHGRRDNDPALGIDYERRISRRFGIGALAEHAFGSEEFSVYAVPVSMHFGRWKAYIAPGVEDSREHGAEFLWRIGGEYGFDVGPIEIAPQLNLDIVDSEAVWVVGVVFAKGF